MLPRRTANHRDNDDNDPTTTGSFRVRFLGGRDNFSDVWGPKRNRGRQARIAELENELRRVAPRDASVEVVVSPSGSFIATIDCADGPLIVAQGRPRNREYGVTPDLRAEEDPGFDDGHPFVFRTLEEAISKIVHSLPANSRRD
ncbi:MAG: hypothetical protein F2817_19150 [Actinobacteria bacterium]|nr:hypothetical protein [Actinomycetota bacterium]